MTTKPMTRSERNILVEHGPYKLRPDGVIEGCEALNKLNAASAWVRGASGASRSPTKKTERQTRHNARLSD